VVNVDKLDFDSADFVLLKKSIQSLSWKERKYMEVKNNFLWQLSNVKSKAAADYLKEVYYAAGDTVEFQYTVLNALLNQKTSYSYSVFKNIMLDEPPVLDVNDKTSTYLGSRGNGSYIYSTYSLASNRRNRYDENDNENFLEHLSDSLQLTATIFKELLPLMNIDDYEEPIMTLAGRLIDSAMIDARDYETYVTQFLIEAKQLLKKQMIMEKNKSIERAQKDDDDDDSNIYNYTIKNDDSGNGELSLYATLLMPFYDKNPAVQQFINQLLKSNDNRLKYNTALLLLKNKRSVPDTLLGYFAALGNYRYELYSDLKDFKLVNLFPSAFNNTMQLAKAKLFDLGGNYNQPDSIVYIDRLPLQFRERNGFVYFFKYKGKRDDSWRIATVGMVPQDPKQFEFENKDNRQRRLYNFTGLTNTRIDNETALPEQLKKVLKRMLYSKRNSAVQFYRDEDRIRSDYYPAFNLGQ
jgi:hypothetical protein